MFGPWNGMLGMPGYGGLLSPEDQAYLRNQGMMSLAGNLLAASGPSPVKQNFGSIAGKGMLGMQQGQQQAMQGLLQNKLYGAKLGEIEREKQRERGLMGLLGQKGEQIGATPYDDEGNPMVTPGTGLLGGKTALPEFYAQMAGLGGDYTKLGMAGLKSLNPSASESPSAVREYEFFKKLGPAEQRQFLEIKRAFQPYTAIDFQGGKAAFDKRVGNVAPLSTAQQEAAGQATVEGAKKKAVVTAEGQAGAALDLPRVESFADQTLKQIDEMRKHPGRQLATGVSSVLPKLPGTSQADFIARLDQLKGGQFLQAYQLLKGAGQISEIEGTKAENAIARMDRAQTEKEFLNALDDYEAVIKTGLDNVRTKAGKPKSSTSAPAPNKRIRVDAQGNVIGN